MLILFTVKSIRIFIKKIKSYDTSLIDWIFYIFQCNLCISKIFFKYLLSISEQIELIFCITVVLHTDFMAILFIWIFLNSFDKADIILHIWFFESFPKCIFIFFFILNFLLIFLMVVHIFSFFIFHFLCWNIYTCTFSNVIHLYFLHMLLLLK